MKAEEKKTDYKKTLNLPRTGFPMRANLSQLEPRIQKKWEEDGLYDRIRQARREGKRYILHDGPPYANGDVHLGTGLNKILKDLLVRTETMKGKDAPFVPGWDCHGLPIEHIVQQQWAGKSIPVLQIRKECEKYARKYLDIQRKQFRRLGVLGAWDHPYLTLDLTYEAGILEVFRGLVEKGYVYRELRPIHWCIECRTALAEAELEYVDHESPSVTVALGLEKGYEKPFRAKAAGPAYLIIWTTTPWTLPANRGVAIHPDNEYVLVEFQGIPGLGTIKGVVAEPLAEAVARMISSPSHRVLGRAKGKELTVLRYEHPFEQRSQPVILADHVTLDEGTGLVHTAPGHGSEDFYSGMENKLEIFSPVDDGGIFTKGRWEGKEVFEANPLIVAELEKRGRLLDHRPIQHRYPICWRCKKPVIFRATKQWFISVEHDGLRGKLLDAISHARWVPDWSLNRISSMVEQRPDWCISRQRAWGVPIPAVHCEGCGEGSTSPDLVEKTGRIFGERGSNTWFSEPVETFLPDGYRCPDCGEAKFRKGMDIFDVWFEAGSSHHAVLTKREDQSFPADLYLEGTDQHRGWFQLSLLPSVATKGVAPFRKVLTHGFVVDEHGKKYSKSSRNYVLAEEAAEKHGADVLRIWVASADYTLDVRFSPEILARNVEAYKKIRNTFRFLLGNLHDFDPARHSIAPEKMAEIDRWVVSTLRRVIATTRKAYEEYAFHRAFQEIYNFCVVELSSIYFDVRKDCLYTEAADSSSRRSAQMALHEALSSLVPLISPILVHTTEEVWEAHGEAQSIHLALWPEPGQRDTGLEEKWERILAIRHEVNRELEALRAAKTIRSSQEAMVHLSSSDPDLVRFLRSQDVWQEVLIVSSVIIHDVARDDFKPGRELKELRVKVARSTDPKCARCWNLRADVGSDASHPEICGRCAGVVTKADG